MKKQWKGSCLVGVWEKVGCGVDGEVGVSVSVSGRVVNLMRNERWEMKGLV